MQIIHKQKQSQWFVPGIHGRLTAPPAAHVIQNTAQDLGVQESTDRQGNVWPLITQQGLAQSGFPRTSLSGQQHWLIGL